MFIRLQPINVLFRSGAFFDEKLSFFFVVAYRKTVTFLRVSSPFTIIFSAFYFDLECKSPHFLANPAHFREKGVRFLTPVAPFLSAVTRFALVVASRA